MYILHFFWIILITIFFGTMQEQIDLRSTSSITFFAFKEILGITRRLGREFWAKFLNQEKLLIHAKSPYLNFFSTKFGPNIFNLKPWHEKFLSVKICTPQIHFRKIKKNFFS